MKIIKYKKLANGMYQLFFDNENNVDLNEEIILKHDLLLKKEVSEKDLDKMLDENQKYIGYNLAIKYLAKKMRSIKEMKEYLISKTIDKETTQEIIDLLIKEKYLDDLLYAKAYINDRILLSSDGPSKIYNKLVELGVDKDIIDQSISIFTDEIQKEKIEKISQKLIKSNRSKSSYILKNKITQYLYNLGYRKDLIIDYLDSVSIEEDSSLAKKEYDKLYKKLSRKYSGSELEYKIKQKMYALGFHNYFE